MKVEHSQISLTPLGERYYKINAFLWVHIIDKKKSYVYEFEPDFVTNFRSGPHVDRFLDQIGNDMTQCAYLVHDANYTPSLSCVMREQMHPMSRKSADDLLYKMLLIAKMPRWKARLVWLAVRVFGSKAYSDDDRYTAGNSTRFSFRETDFPVGVDCPAPANLKDFVPPHS